MDFAAEYEVRLEMSRASAWQKLRDLSLAHNYVPGVIRTELTTAEHSGVGASRRVYQSATRGLDETVIEWVDGQGFLIRLHQGNEGAPAPFSEASFRYWLEDTTDGNSTMQLTLSYTVRWGALGRVLQRLVLGKAIRGTVRDVALCLREFYQSGVPVDAQRLRELRGR